MQIGFLCSEYPILRSSHGGIGSVTQTLARELVKQGHGAVVYAAAEEDSEGEDEGVRVVLVRSGHQWPSILRLRRRLQSDLHRGVVDVIESPECEAHRLPGGRGTIVRMHGSHHYWNYTLAQKPRMGRLLLEQLGVRQAYGLCAVSAYTAKLTRKLMRLGRRPIEILYNPVNVEAFRPQPDTVVPQRIVFAGSVVEKKGVRELCQSMARVVANWPNAELLVAGRDGPAPDGSPSFRRAIEAVLDPQTRSHIQFLGHRPLCEISQLMASAQVCVFPSYMETQGLVAVEAMACGRPVIFTQEGPGPEVLGENGQCGWLVNPRDPADIADKIGRIFSDPERANHMGKAGRRRAEEQFSVTAVLQRNLAFYRRCAVPRGRQTP